MNTTDINNIISDIYFIINNNYTNRPDQIQFIKNEFLNFVNTTNSKIKLNIIETIMITIEDDIVFDSNIISHKLIELCNELENIINSAHDNTIKNQTLISEYFNKII